MVSVTPGPDLLGGLAARARVVLPLSFAAVVVVAAVYLHDPHGVGALLAYAGIVVCALSIAVGPLLRGARPRRIWILVTVGMLFLIAALVSKPLNVTIASVPIDQVFYLTGYLSLAGWLWRLSACIGTGGATQVLLDAAAATVGAFLATWTLAGIFGDSRDPHALVWSLYVVLDVLVLALAVHLAFRLPTLLAAWRWLIIALVVQIVLDTSSFVGGLMSPTGHPPQLTGFYLFAYWGLAASATHPTVVDLTRRVDRPRPKRDSRLRASLIMLGVVPAVAALASPVTDAVDTIVRSVLVSALLILMFARLLLTMAEVSRAEAESRHRSLHDPLTGLVNRAGLFEVLGQRLERDAENGLSTAILFLDCDDFKHVNDTWGHPAGDALLCGIADGLPQRLRKDDLLVRLGGDEFVILATVHDPSGAVRVAERAIDFFTTPLPVRPERTHLMTPSIGIAVACPTHVRSAVEILEMADAALYEAKSRGRAQFVLFDDELEQRARYRAAVSDVLRTAITDGGISLSYQPILAGAGYADLVGWEALARWTDPTLGEIPPSVFVPLAEEHGLIDALGEAILRRACKELAVLRRELDLPHATVSVNVAAPQLRAPDFPLLVTDALAAAGLTGDALWLEVTETSLLETSSALLCTIRRLQSTGVKVCLDDFGTGHSSIDLFFSRSVDCVKLDKTLVQRLVPVPEAREQLSLFLDLLSSLHVTMVVGEGVETPEQAAALEAVGCPMAQGWLYGRAASLEQLLAQRGVESP